MKTDWRTVTAKSRCPICEHPDWCGVAADGTAAICMRVQSAHPTKNGGWLHQLDRKPLPRFRLPPPRPVHREPDQDFAATLQEWRQKTTPAQLADLAHALGVDAACIESLGAAWAPPHLAWAFPMRDAAGAVIGIRLRSMDGRKWAVRGSSAGLFYVPGLTAAPVMIVEGPTDAAAALQLGFYAIGRPSCRGQEELVRDLVRTVKGDVLIMSDRDAAKMRPDGSKWFPGQEGAAKLATDLKRPCRILIPPLKDIRAWLQAGATREAVLALARSARWLNVR